MAEHEELESFTLCHAAVLQDDFRKLFFTPQKET